MIHFDKETCQKKTEQGSTDRRGDGNEEEERAAMPAWRQGYQKNLWRCHLDRYWNHRVENQRVLKSPKLKITIDIRSRVGIIQESS